MIFAAALAAGALHLLPAPAHAARQACAAPFGFSRPLRIDARFDPAAADEIDERWRAQGLPALQKSTHPDIRVVHANLPAQAYRLRTESGGSVTIEAGDGDGAFYGAMTLAQLPERGARGWTLPCVQIADEPALRWRILSDDVSRGPLPTMRYFEERIRTIAAFKMNGYSPYMEHVFAAPSDPLPAPLDGITPAQLHELWQYAARFHVTLVPEQQSFAHMHNTLRYEEYAPAAETPHAFLLSPASPLSLEYMRRIIGEELNAIPHPPFFHIGSDETSALGGGLSAPMAQRMGGISQLYALHVNQMNAVIKPSGARLMLWDDGVENDPKIMKMIPRDAVLINWHYNNAKTFMPYINLLKNGGFQQMVAPGDNNWNSVYPDINVAIANENTFITEGKRAHVLGLFQTVWNDDGETLFEATWYPVLYAAVSAWEQNPVSVQRYQRDFPSAFFGVDDARYGQDLADLADVQGTMSGSYDYTSDFLMWADPFGPLFYDHMKTLDVRALRLKAEAVETHLIAAHPPLHANAARVMFLAARKYDFIGRKYQAAQEIRDTYYGHKPYFRGVAWSQYWLWELRDGYEELEPLYAAAWRYEDRESHLGSNLERYGMAAQRAIARADRLGALVQTWDGKAPLPPLDQLISP